jgi:hypothetical protein
MYWRRLTLTLLFLGYAASAAKAGPGNGPDPLGGAKPKGGVAVVNSTDGTNVYGQPGIARPDLTLTPGPQSDAGDDGDALPPGAAVCFGGIDIAPPDEDVDVFIDVVSRDRQGKRVVTHTYDRTERHITYMCNGQPFKTITRCIRGNCPPPSTKPPRRMSLNKVLNQLMASGTLTLPMPNITTTPKPSDIAPLVGMPFFYGVTAAQFNDIQTLPLTLCFDEDCGSLILSAAPRAVYFNPKRSMPDDPSIKTTCKQPMPEIHSAADAAQGLPARNCAVVFQNSGHYPVEYGLAYELIWSINRWNFTQRPPIERGNKKVVVWTNTELTIHQIQPVLTGIG